MRAALIAALALWLFGAPPAGACIGAGCTCGVAAQDVAFGLYDPLSPAPNDSVGRVSITCGAQIAVFFSYQIKLSAGAGTYGARRMLSGGDQLQYQLYTDAAHAQIWGDGSAGTGFIANAYTLSLSLSRTDEFSVYGRIPAAQNAKPGAYSDTILVTVTF